jgi:hypothetical protein
LPVHVSPSLILGNPEPGTAKRGYQPCGLAKEYEYKKNAGLCVLNPDALIVKLLSPTAEEPEFMVAVFDIVFRGQLLNATGSLCRHI